MLKSTRATFNGKISFKNLQITPGRLCKLTVKTKVVPVHGDFHFNQNFLTITLKVKEVYFELFLWSVSFDSILCHIYSVKCGASDTNFSNWYELAFFCDFSSKVHFPPTISAWMLQEMCRIRGSSARVSRKKIRSDLTAGCLFAGFEERSLAFSHKGTLVHDEISAKWKLWKSIPFRWDV